MFTKENVVNSDKEENGQCAGEVLNGYEYILVMKFKF